MSFMPERKRLNSPDVILLSGNHPNKAPNADRRSVVNDILRVAHTRNTWFPLHRLPSRLRRDEILILLRLSCATIAAHPAQRRYS